MTTNQATPQAFWVIAYLGSFLAGLTLSFGFSPKQAALVAAINLITVILGVLTLVLLGLAVARLRSSGSITRTTNPVGHIIVVAGSLILSILICIWLALNPFDRLAQAGITIGAGIVLAGFVAAIVNSLVRLLPQQKDLSTGLR